MNKIKLVSIFVATIILLSLVAPMLFIQPVSAADPASWYTTVPGVLTSDYYVLYPFNTYSIDFGLSKFGEMINYPVAPGVGLGLQYPGYDKVGTYNQKLTYARDPFANEYVNPKYWINGWLIEVRYTHRTLRDRYIIAMALFADMNSYGGDWLVGHKLPLTTAPHGGRKTNTYAETEDLKVLYNGPRLYVAESVTHLYDWFDSDGDDVVDHPDETWPVVDIILKFVFEKVKKYVIIFKDVKQVISGKELDSPLDIQFSNREEWDLGPTPDYTSYAHFYHQEFETCYGPEWHVANGIMREFKVSGYNITEVPIEVTAADETVWVGPIIDGSVRVYVNGVWREPGRDYDIDPDTGEITWWIPIDPKDWIEVVYKLWKGEKIGYPYPIADISINSTYAPIKGVPHLYDVAQIISSDLKYVGFKAFWPVLSDYTVDGWALTFQPLINVSEPDMIPLDSEPDIPLVIGEWDFMLGHGYPAQFRGVEVVGLTERHDADDANIEDGTHDDVLDREVKYLLDEVFNPWDLVSAVHKETKRWVEFFTGDDTWSERTLEHRPVVGRELGAWYEYCSFAERVLVDGVLLTPTDARIWDESKWSWWPSFPYTYNITDGTIYFWKDADGKMTTKGDAAWKVEKGKVVKVLYSTLPRISDHNVLWTLNTKTFKNVTVGQPLFISLDDIDEVWTDNWGVTHDVYLDVKAITVTIKEGGNWTKESLNPIWGESETDFKVFVGEIHEGTVSDISPGGTLDLENATATYDVDEFSKSISAIKDSSVTWPLSEETLHVDNLLHVIYAYVYVKFTDCGAKGNETFISAAYAVYTQYDAHLGGRYEWTIVGRDAHTVDSAGAALVTAAFKNKQVEIGLAGADMMETTIVNAMPWVMHKFGTGNTKADYKDALDRAALKDDWCTTWPVASSNMIAVGGPLANMLAYYANDFTPAFFGLQEYASADWAGKIIALSCWRQNPYESTEETGYAVVTTYKDLNGTVLFLIWGHWGRDTYYATKWFHEEGIYQLQEFPDCATAIILKIDYTVHEPTVSVVEVLGTISETLAHEVKGGIHVDP